MSVTFEKGDILAYWSVDSSIIIWNLTYGELIRTLNGHNDWVNSVAFGKGDILASRSHDDTIKIWNMTTGNFSPTTHKSSPP